MSGISKTIENWLKVLADTDELSRENSELIIENEELKESVSTLRSNLSMKEIEYNSVRNALITTQQENSGLITQRDFLDLWNNILLIAFLVSVVFHAWLFFR